MLVLPITVAIFAEAGKEPFPSTCAEPVMVRHFHDWKLFCESGADLFIDCEFVADPDHINDLKKLLPTPVMVNAVCHSTKEIGADFIRFDGWMGFGQQTVLELASQTGRIPEIVEEFATSCGHPYVIAPDSVGMVRARIVAMIINEAFLALGEGVSQEEDIDTAMKHGTNYPFGPFEWAEKIGHSKVVELLQKMALTDSKYEPAPALVAAAK